MPSRTKLALIAFLLIINVSFFAQAQVTNLRDLQRTAESFSQAFTQALPLNSSIGLNWADSHIGQLFPSIPPRFGIGVAAGFTTVNISEIANLTEQIGAGGELPDISRLLLPGYTIEARVGGFILPFDVGLKFGTLPNVAIMENFYVDYLLLGGDIRYAIFRRSPLNVSVGVGFSHLRGGITARASGLGTSFSFVDPTTGNTRSFSIGDPEAGLFWRSTTLDFTAQVSRRFLIITPYLGLGISHSWTAAGYDVRAAVTGDFDQDAIDRYLAGIPGINVSTSGITSTIYNNAIGARIFGGLALNLAVFRVDLTGILCLRNADYGLTLGLRFQL